MVDGARECIKEVTGEECPTCPWRAFAEPVVRDVLTLQRTVGADGSPALLIPDDPPHHLWEGLLLYRSASAHTRTLNQEEDDAERERERNRKQGLNG